MDHLLRKKTRIRIQEKKRLSKRTGTLAGQVLRLKTVKGYKKGNHAKVKII